MRIASDSEISCNNFSLCWSVELLFGTSTSSNKSISARLPVMLPVMPTDLTLGLWVGVHPPMSKLILDHRYSSPFGLM